jgi:hypothetical protein
LFDDLLSECGPETVRPVLVKAHEIGSRLPGDPLPVVLIDLRAGGVGVADIAALRQARPRVPVVALVDAGTDPKGVFEAGAVAVLPADATAVLSCVTTILRSRPEGPLDANVTGPRASGYSRLRRILSDLRAGLLSATVALNLLHILSESVERAVLFLVRPRELMALGAFGFSALGRPLAQITRRLELPTGGDDVFSRAVIDGVVRSLSVDHAELPPGFLEVIGRPQFGQAVVFPVLGTQRVISLIYADNGATNRAIEDIELLELATAQVGMAFENELLRRQVESPASR